MLEGLTILIVLQLLGEIIAGLTRVPVPGPVIGLALLVGYALWRGALPKSVEEAGDGILRHLSLLFVPAGVGLIAFGPLLVNEGPRLILVLILSTAITMAVTAFAFRLFTRESDDAPPGDTP